MSTPGSLKNRAKRQQTSLQAGNNQQQNAINMLRFYSSDETPGIKIGPTTVLVLSLSFIAFVVLLHIYGKIASKVTSTS